MANGPLTGTSPPSDPPLVTWELAEDGVALVLLNRPDRLNAMNDELTDTFVRVLETVGADEACRAVVVSGAGRAFCAGGDIDGFDAINPEKATVPQMLRIFERAGDLAKALHTIPKPVIAAVNGAAVGGGLSIALAADTRICGESAKFSAAFVKLGLSGCEMGLSWLLPRIVGPTAAYELAYSGRLVRAEEALRIGLVLEVVPDDRLVERALEIARTFAANSPIGLRMTKALMNQGLSGTSFAEAMDNEARTQLLVAHTRDHREGYTSFVEKRTAVFRNG